MHIDDLTLSLYLGSGVSIGGNTLKAMDQHIETCERCARRLEILIDRMAEIAQRKDKPKVDRCGTEVLVTERGLDPRKCVVHPEESSENKFVAPKVHVYTEGITSWKEVACRVPGESKDLHPGRRTGVLSMLRELDSMLNVLRRRLGSKARKTFRDQFMRLYFSYSSGVPIDCLKPELKKLMKFVRMVAPGSGTYHRRRVVSARDSRDIETLMLHMAQEVQDDEKWRDFHVSKSQKIYCTRGVTRRIPKAKKLKFRTVHFRR